MLCLLSLNLDCYLGFFSVTCLNSSSDWIISSRGTSMLMLHSFDGLWFLHRDNRDLKAHLVLEAHQDKWCVILRLWFCFGSFFVFVFFQFIFLFCVLSSPFESTYFNLMQLQVCQIAIHIL